MNFGIFSYTATILIFTGLALLLRIVKRLIHPSSHQMLSNTEWKVIGCTALITTIGTAPAEWAALTWRTWSYNPERTFDTRFLGAEVETYLFTILVTFVISVATLSYARRQDRKLAQIQNSESPDK